MIRITGKSMLEESYERSNQINYDNIASAERIVETIVRKEFETSGATCFSIGYRNKNSVTPYEFSYYQKDTVYLNKKEWGIMLREIQDAGFRVEYKDRDSTIDNDGYVVITMRF